MQLTTTRHSVGPDRKASRQLPCASLYLTPPMNEITLDEFELYALDRLRLLRSIEELKVKNVEGDAFRNALDANIRKFDLNCEEEGQDWRDLVSHFILRLAYCRTEDLRRWFLQQECVLFKHRLESANKTHRFRSFMSHEKLSFDYVGAGELLDLKEQLSALNKSAETEYYKIPFEQALSLVSRRGVFLRAGWAFVPHDKLTSIIITKFRIQLSRALVSASNVFETVTPDQRIAPLLKNMNKQYTGRDFSNQSSVDQLSASQVDLAADIHMPLCMKNIHDNLLKDGKTKHWGRLQYGLFLKGAGLSLEDALQFWESHFAKAVPHDQFQKQYAYSFRHMYGKEGARKAYTPYSCMKIILGTPPEPGAHHGCPYKHASDAELGAMLMNLKIDSQDAHEIGKIARSGNFQIACQKHYDVTHPDHLSMMSAGSDNVANHPNQWYQSSVEYHKVKFGAVKLEPASTTVDLHDATVMEISPPQEA